MRDIPGYEGLYGITSCGRVWSYRRKKYLKPGKGTGGYLHVILCKDGKAKNFYIHRLVAEAYLPNPLNLPQINHKDENKTNNALPNLEWCTAAYNINYSHCKRVQCVETGVIYNSIIEAAKAVDIDPSSISHCLAGRYKTAGGYHWRYYDEKEEI